ncbi:hypothetical protein [Agromyces flavus]|uniref:hypothetical protein n=1 Tax=Agromyces flavus TaxID=589382 RepID=UPI00361C7903
MLLMAGSDDEQRRATDFIMAGHVDGALLVSSHRGREGFLKTLVDAEVPVVSCGIPSGTSGASATSRPTTSTVRRDMVAYLRGRRRTLAHRDRSPVRRTTGGLGRLEGYRAELGDAFDERLVVAGDYSVPRGWGDGGTARTAARPRRRLRGE